MKQRIENTVHGFFIAGCFAAVIALSGCSLLFEPNETSGSKIETYAQMASITDGVYVQLGNAVKSEEFYCLNFNADDCYKDGQLYYSYYGDDNCKIYYYNFDEDFVYTSLYKVIASANNILSQYNLEKVSDRNTKAVLGELFFLRSYCYFRLARSYGQVPLIDNTDISYTVEKPSYAEEYEFIECDLLKATELLPDNNNTSRVPYQTPHRGTAKALLAELYLSWAGYPIKDETKYTLAASTAAEVIDSSGYYGFELLPDFADLWNKSGRYNNESVFSYFGDYSKGAIYGGNCTYAFSEEVNFRIGGTFTTDNRYFYTDLNFSTEVDFYNKYPKEYRKDITFYTSIFVPKFYDFTPDSGTTYSIDTIDQCSRASFRKFYIDTALTVFWDLSDESFINIDFYFMGNPRIYILRYAQTLLTYAEAAARSGKLDDKAYTCINRIRRRAHHLDLDSPSPYDLQSGLSADAFADSVVQERAWELAGETEGRWFDLLRLEKLDEVLAPNVSMEDNYLYKKNLLKNYFLPLPQSDAELNPNLKR